jgi:hypothetical protein
LTPYVSLERRCEAGVHSDGLNHPAESPFELLLVGVSNFIRSFHQCNTVFKEQVLCLLPFDMYISGFSTSSIDLILASGSLSFIFLGYTLYELMSVCNGVVIDTVELRKAAQALSVVDGK